MLATFNTIVWGKDDILLENGDLAVRTGNDAFIASLYFHLMTDPGEYEPDPSLGVGLAQWIGRIHKKENVAQLRRELTSYLARHPDFLEYLFRVEVESIDAQSVKVRIQAVGEGLDSLPPTEILVSTKTGISFSYFEEDKKASVFKTEPADAVNPYIARLSQT